MEAFTRYPLGDKLFRPGGSQVLFIRAQTAQKYKSRNGRTTFWVSEVQK
jgi:hypothetical protein